MSVCASVPARSRAVIAAVLVWAACTPQRRATYEPVAGPEPAVHPAAITYRVGFEPLRPTRRLWDRFNPMIAAINASSPGFRLELESALTHTTYLEKFRRADFDFGLFEPHLVLEAETLGYSVFARTGYRDRIAGVVVARRGAGIRAVRDLRGKAICYGAIDALASTMLTRLWLREAGLREKDVDVVFTGSQESALLEVFAGTAAAAAASRDGWREFQISHPEEAQELELKWRTQDLSGPALMAHARVPAKHRQRVAQALVALRDTPEGRDVLAATRFSEFRPAVSGSYDDVWEFINAYRHTFGARPWAAVPR